MSLKTFKNGNVNDSAFSNSIVNQYDTNFYYESDGSTWIRVVHHNNPTNYKFASTDTFSTSVYTDTNRWFNAALCKINTVGKWELMIKQKQESSSGEEKYRWIQNTNPMAGTYEDIVAANITKFTTGYTTIGSSYGGLYAMKSNSYMVCANGTKGNWWGSVGCWTAYNGGIPGYNGNLVKTGYIDLYYRIDNISLNGVRVFNVGTTATDFIEN
mgnify:CR=1 FL=1